MECGAVSSMRFDLGEPRERRSVGILPVFLACVSCVLAGVPTGVGALETVKRRGRGFRRERSVGPIGDMGSRERKLQLMFCFSPETTLEDFVWRTKGFVCLF